MGTSPGKDRSHVLVVGGTGMLRGVSLYFAERGDFVSVVARGEERLRSLADDAAAFAGEIVPLPLDYWDSAKLERALTASMTRYGPISLAVCWVHSVASDPLVVVAKALVSASASPRLFHVRGSASANPAAGGPRIPQSLAALPTLRYRQVILGFVIENGRSRWLTHREISDGVVAAVTSDRDTTIVGTVEPWSMRP